ncbi:MAG: hypothetical protein QOE28_3107 [Solirubrobacteraceae bacterium]|jgi:hypothetical protein|nr:hypothetical protein [Solirubrobacteraceae bacterium]
MSKRTLFRIESGLSAALGLLALMTLVWHDWMEAFGWDPDHGDGSAEWVAVAVLAVAAIATGLAARRRRQRLAPIDSA